MSGIHYQDVVLMNQALQNAGNDALRRRSLAQQNDQAMARLALEDEIRKVNEARYNAQLAHWNEIENQNAQRGSGNLYYIIDQKSGNAKSVIGTPQEAQAQLEQWQQQHPDNDFVLSNKMPADRVPHQLADGSTIYVKPEEKAKLDQQAQGTGKATNFPQLVNNFNSETQLANEAKDNGDDDAADFHSKIAGMYQSQIDKLNSGKQGHTTTNQYDEKGHRTSSTTSYGSPQGGGTPQAGGTPADDNQPVRGENMPALDPNMFGGGFHQSKVNPNGVTLSPEDLDLINHQMTNAPAQTVGTPPQQQNQPAPVPKIPTINSQDEYDALAPGSQYMDSNGRLATKKAVANTNATTQQ